MQYYDNPSGNTITKKPMYYQLKSISSRLLNNFCLNTFVILKWKRRAREMVQWVKQGLRAVFESTYGTLAECGGVAIIPMIL